MWRLIIYKTENSKGNFTVFEGPLAVGLSAVPKECPWKLSLITRTHLTCSRGNSDLKQLPVLLSQFKKWTGQHTFHRRWMLDEIRLLTPFMWILIRKTSQIFIWKTYSLDYFKLAPSTFHYFPYCKIQTQFSMERHMLTIQVYKTNVCLPHSNERN